MAQPPSRSTIHYKIVILRQVLKTVQLHAWLTHLPDLSPLYGTRGKISQKSVAAKLRVVPWIADARR